MIEKERAAGRTGSDAADDCRTGTSASAVPCRHVLRMVMDDLEAARLRSVQARQQKPSEE